MADDLNPLSLMAPQAPTPTTQAPPPFLAALQQAAQGNQQAAASPTGMPQAPQLNDPMKDPLVQALLQKYQKDPSQQLQDVLKQNYWHVNPGEEPSKGSKIMHGILEALMGLAQGKKYQTPEERYAPMAATQYQDQTGRLQGADTLARLGQTYGYNQAKLQENNDKLQAQIQNNRDKIDLGRGIEVDKNTARTVTNQIKDRAEKAKEGLYTAQEDDLYYKTLIHKFDAENPGLSDTQLTHMLASQEVDPQTIMRVLGARSAIALAKNPYVATGATNEASSSTVNGVTTQTNQHTINRGMLPQVEQNVQNLLNYARGNAAPGATGAPSALSAAKPTIPFMPSAQPQATGAAPAASPKTMVPGLPLIYAGADSGKYINPRRDATNVVFNDKTIQPARDKAMAELDKRVRGIDTFGMQANGGANALLGALADGSAKDFTGWFNGNQVMKDFRNSLGIVSPQEQLLRGNGIDTLYGKLISNGIRGRFTVPEISGHAQVVGGQQLTARNYLQSMAAMKLQSDVQKLFERGLVDQNDVPELNKVINSELNRVTDMTKDSQSIQDAQKNGTYKINNLEDLYKIRAKAPDGSDVRIPANWDRVQTLRKKGYKTKADPD